MFLLLSVFIFVLVLSVLVFIFVLILAGKLKFTIDPILRIGDDECPKSQKIVKPKGQVIPEKPVTPPKAKFTRFELIMILLGLFSFIQPIVFLVLENL